MFFETLHIRGFGCLRTTVEFANDRLNLTIANNEGGKSTLVAAILAAFYGLREDDPDDLSGSKIASDNQDSIVGDKRPLRKNVKPWTNPEEFGLTLDFTIERSRWRIERDFAARTVRIINRDTGGDRTSEFHRGQGVYRLGEDLFGLTCDDFLKSFYLQQSEFGEIREAGGLAPHIQRVATSEEGGVTSENAILRLQDSLSKYQIPGQPVAMSIESALSKLSIERDSIQSQLGSFSNSKTKIITECQRLAEIENQISDIEQELTDAEIAHEMAEFTELKKIISNQELLVTEKHKLKKSKKELLSFKNFPEGDTGKLLEIVGRVEELRVTRQNLEEKQEAKVDAKLAEINTSLEGHESLSDVDEPLLKQFENAMSLYTDRTERLQKFNSDLQEKEEVLLKKGVDKVKLNKFRNVFSGLTGDDKRFIDDYRAVYATAEGELREAKSRTDWLKGEKDLIEARQKRTGITVRVSLIVTAVLLTAGTVLAMTLFDGWIGQVIIGVGIIFGSVGVIIRGLSSGSDANRLDSILEDIEGSEGEEQNAIKKMEELSQYLLGLASKVGFSDSNKFLTVYTNYDRISELTEPLAQAEQALAEAVHDEQIARSWVVPYFEKVTEEMPEDETRLEVSNALLIRYQQVEELNSQRIEVETRQSEYQEELDWIDTTLKANLDVCAKYLNDAGIEEVEPISEAVKLYQEKHLNHQRFKTIVDEELPRVERNLISDSQVVSKRERLRFLEERLTSKLKAIPIELSTEEYRAQVEDLSDKKELLNLEKQKLQRRIGLVFENNYSMRSNLLAHLYEVDSEITYIETFQSEIEAAMAILDDISQEVYQEWAEALSIEAAPIIEHLNPRYGELNFGEDLSFTIHDKENNKTLSSDVIESVLSNGARDEVFLAARLGMSSYLARGVKGAIPIILDEPLSSTDDDKFLSGMRFFLCELSYKHQVLLMSCHQERHEWLSKREMKIYKNRINMIELGTDSISN
ncbi:MAG: hypothetical protein HN590_11885 [Calditrichaeota bacterium]|nr:hypothetical protein [Calditrichota bacterium]MBT7787419.1 hypothetical protein [Calditrichota bacterium]